MSERSFIAELQRRNVHRAAMFYAGAAWLLVQIATQVFPFFDVPNGTVRVVVIAALIGFPFAMLLSWFYEWTPDGIKRESEIDRSEPAVVSSGGKFDRWIIAVLAAAVAVLLANLFVLHKPARSESNAKSIAVLPFENLSEDKANAYFASGMQDEILTRLAGIHDLKVISRTSTEQYASHPPNLKVVAEQLGVASVLEGSVQRADGKVRINLQLIDAATDSHLWAQNYDRDLKDVFAVQSDVAEKVADALKAQLLPAESTRIASVPTRNPAAYDQFLQADYFIRQIDSGSAKNPAEVERKAAALFESAIVADPDFALAYARLSYLKASAYWTGIDSSPQAIKTAEAAARQALMLQPNLAEAHLAMGYVHYRGRRDYAAALAEFSAARASLPNDASVIAAIAYVHRRQGDLQQAVGEFKQAELLDPRDTKLPLDLGDTLMYLRRYAEAEAAFDRSLALTPENIQAAIYRAVAIQMRGDLEGSRRALAAIPADADPQGSVSLARFRLALTMRQPDAVLATISKAPIWLTDDVNNVVVPSMLFRARALALKGEDGPARAAFLDAGKTLESSLRDSPESAGVKSNLAIVYAGLGQKDAALKAGRRATELLPLSQDMLDGSFYLARLAKIEAQVGETAPALGHIEQLLGAPAGYEVSVAALRTDPVWDALRGDPRFQKLIAGGDADTPEPARP